MTNGACKSKVLSSKAGSVKRAKLEQSSQNFVRNLVMAQFIWKQVDMRNGKGVWLSRLTFVKRVLTLTQGMHPSGSSTYVYMRKQIDLFN